MGFTDQTRLFARRTKSGLNLCILIAMVGLVVACRSFPGTPTPVIVDPGQAECQDRVLVIVWGDRNRNGLQDSDELPLANVLLMMAQKDDPSSEGIQFSTGTDGKAHFPTRELDDCRTLGYQVLFLRQVAGYEFPSDPVVDLNDFNPNEEIVRFGLLPLNENEN